MKREDMAALAQKIAGDSIISLPEHGCRVVVVVTDAEGAFVGVGSTTRPEDTRNILWFALAGEDPIVHQKQHIDTEGEEVRDGT